MHPQQNQRWNVPPPSMQPRFPPMSPQQRGGRPHFWRPQPMGNQWRGGHPGAQLMNLEQFGTPAQQRFPVRPPPPRGPMHGPSRGGPPPRPGGPQHQPGRGMGPGGPRHHQHQHGRGMGPGPRGPQRPLAPGNFKQPQFNPGQQGKKQKKPKVDKRELPENNKFYCDTCDRGYKDEDKYQLHIQDHKQCPNEGCSYIAAAKLVTLHVKLQHTSGLAKKVWSLESQEDIQKWREERRKNFPSAANIAKKKAELEEKIARGEVIEEKYFGKMRQRGQGRGRGRGRGRWQPQGEGQAEMGSKHKLSEDSVTSSSPAKQMKPNTSLDKSGADVAATTTELSKINEDVTGTKATDGLPESIGVFFKVDSSSDSDSDSDSDDLPLETPTAKPNPVTAAGALGSLITAYSDSEEEEVEKQEVKSDKPDQPSKAPTANNTNSNNNNNNNKGNRNRQRTRNRKGNAKFQTKEYKLDKSLLEKLLAKEIRQERNKIMQCVHYIVKQNFFDDVKV